MNRRDVLKAGAGFALASLRTVAGDDRNSPLKEISSNAGLRVTLFANGQYQVTAASFGWTFGGTVGRDVQSVSVVAGTDGNGSWQEVSFEYDTARHSAIRIWDEKPVALFTTSYGQESPNAEPFPRFDAFPQRLFPFSYTTLWGYDFTSLGNRSPWLFYDQSANAVLLSPAANFMTSYTRIASDGAIEPGIDGRITTFPAGFTHRTVLALGQGINAAFENWGHFLTGLSGKVRPANDAITLLNKLSYWTDATTAYYYRPSDPTQYVPTLQQVKTTFDKLSLPISSLELDSWHYPKGSPASWTQVSAGLSTYQADPKVFPKGLGAFQASLGVSLIAHTRWIDSSSDLRNKYTVSGNVAIDPQYWQDFAKYLSENGVEVLEQDWLSGPAITDFNLTAPDAFLDNMASAMAADGRSIVYCMPTTPHVLQSSRYNNVLVARAAHDGLTRQNWDDLLINSRLSGAVGLWPFTDAHTSAKSKDLLLSVLTAGPVGSGDNVSSIDEVNLRQAVRRDGVIVKPDAPIYPVDAAWVARSVDASAPMVASTYTDHGGLHTGYLFAYARVQGGFNPISVTAQSVGVSGAAYFYDYFAKTGKIVPPGSPFTHTVDYNGSYFIVAPLGPSGIAFLGDAGKFVSTGKKRIQQISDDGTLLAVVSFASGEPHVQLAFYTSRRPAVKADAGKVTAPLIKGDNLYRVTVSPDSAGKAILRFTTSPSSDVFA